MSQIVYLVKQTQPNADYFETTIYVCSTFEKAQSYARTLNKEYGEHCVFDENWDFIEYDLKGDPHYYSVESMAIDKPLAYLTVEERVIDD